MNGYSLVTSRAADREDRFVISLTGEEAAELLRRTTPAGAPITSPEKVDRFRRSMRDELWHPRETLTFTREGEQLRLADGRHRLAAHAGLDAGTAIDWTIRIENAGEDAGSAVTA